MRRLTLIFMALLAAAPAAWAGGTNGAPFLTIGVGARAAGMGEAFTAVADDASAIAWNPGGLGAIDSQQLALMHALWDADTSVDNLGYVLPLGTAGSLGLAATYLSMQPFEITDAANPAGNGQTIAINDLALSLGCGLNLGQVHGLGASVKYLRRQLGAYQATAVAGDAGYLWKITPGLKAGAAVLNFGQPVTFISQADNLPLTCRGGLAWEALNSGQHELTAALDVVDQVDSAVYGCVGAEYWFDSRLALRAGYKTLPDNPSLSVGVGLQAPLLGLRQAGIDYAYTYQNGQDLTATHRLSMRCAF